ncbi:MAG: heavy metal translocating P-type ATPase [Bacilli bacterium]|nr:heavy metal translocating P-type ATPase [Bacilli bacterium]
MTSEKFKITGMSCASCQTHVQSAVMKVLGVKDVEVNLLTNSMNVTYARPASVKNICQAVQAVGYGANVSTDENFEEDNSETRRIVKRLVISAILLLILMYVTMGHLMWGWPIFAFLDNPVGITIIEFFLSSIILVLNREFFIHGIKGVIHKAMNMDTLISLGSGLGFLYSVGVSVLIISATVNHDITLATSYLDELYYETSAMILVLITIGELLESYSKGKTTTAIKALMKLTPPTAHLVSGETTIDVAVSEVKINDTFKVLPGEAIPVDGIIISGESAIDESLLTGESLPIDKKVNDEVKAGTMNKNGALICQANHVGEDTSLSKIIKLVGEASSSKAPIGRFADRISGVFVPIVMSIALLTVIVWLIISSGDIGYSLTRGICVLVVSCPCALGLATPVAIMVGNGVGAKNGILFKNATALEETNKLQIVVFDKTGTLTKGEVVVTDIIPCGISEDSLLSYAASLENNSEHPLAEAIVKKALESKVHLEDVTGFSALPGVGVIGQINGRTIQGGKNARLNQEYLHIAEELSLKGKTPLYFELEGNFIGIIAVADTIKDDAVSAIAELKAMGLQVVMLTGDNTITASSIANRLGIRNVIAGVLPEQKEQVIKHLRKQGKVAMVGDGINDAPALTRADIGIAIGAGSDVALDAADVVLEKSQLKDVPASIRLSRRTLNKIKGNLMIALVYNLFGIPLVAGVFIPFGLVLDPMIASLMHCVFSVAIVCNALLLNLTKIYKADHHQVNNVELDLVWEEENMKKELIIEGMKCEHCASHVKEALESLAGVEDVTVSLEKKEATLVTSVKDEVLIQAIKKAGYDAKVK